MFPSPMVGDNLQKDVFGGAPVNIRNNEIVEMNLAVSE
jgi:hypothetical protein